MGGLIITGALLVLCFKIGHCAYCDQHSIPFPGVVKNNTRFFLDGESFAISCHKGYRSAIINGKFTCSNGVWSGHFPPCAPADCLAPPPSVHHGKILAFKREHLSSVVYRCDDHYFPAADYGVQCVSGEWKGSPPMCKDSRCYLRDLKLKEGLLQNTGFTRSGESLNVGCGQGYASIGMQPMCSRGVWTEYGTSPCKEVSCTVPAVRNGALAAPKDRRVWRWSSLSREKKEAFKKVDVGKEKSPGTVLYVSCDSKHTFQGKGLNNVATSCGKGKWTPDPVCLK